MTPQDADPGSSHPGSTDDKITEGGDDGCSEVMDEDDQSSACEEEAHEETSKMEMADEDKKVEEKSEDEDDEKMSDGATSEERRLLEQGPSRSSDSSSYSSSTSSTDSSSDESEKVMREDEMEGDDDRQEEDEKTKERSKMRGTNNAEQAGLTINYQYPRSNLKRWSTSVQSSFIDVTSDSSYTVRLLQNQKRKQTTLNRWTIPTAAPVIQIPSYTVGSTVQQPLKQERLRSAISQDVPFAWPYFIFTFFLFIIPFEFVSSLVYVHMFVCPSL